MKNLESIDKLVDSFARLPSIGRKTAERLAFSILNMDSNEVDEFATSLKNVKSKIHQCPICGLYTENDKCEICSDTSRKQDTIIVLSYPKDVYNFEKLNSYDGLYHVLNGNISAIKGTSINDLNIESLLMRVNKGIKEVIIATDPTIEGETTAMYIAKLLEDKNVNVTRLAYGLPMGGHLDYADSLTILKALEGRKKI